MSSTNALADESNIAGRIYLCLGLLQYPYFVYASSEGSGESVHVHRLTRVFVARQCDISVKISCAGSNIDVNKTLPKGDGLKICLVKPTCHPAWHCDHLHEIFTYTKQSRVISLYTSLYVVHVSVHSDIVKSCET